MLRKSKGFMLEDSKFQAQLAGVVVGTANNFRFADEIAKLAKQDSYFLNAVREIDKVREFVGTPQNILGSDKTKHGEIAEQVEIGIRNAKSAFENKPFTATKIGVGRTAPEDYLLNGIPVQSKFINGVGNNLDSVIEHMTKYPYFGRDNSFYHIPKDAYALIDKIQHGEPVEGLKLSTIQAIKEQIESIEKAGNKSFKEIVKPGISKYAEVQQGSIHKTLDNHQADFDNKNQYEKGNIHKVHGPSVADGLKVAGVSAVVGATVSITANLYKKYKEGKCFYKGDFTLTDWKETFHAGVSGGGVGALSGGAIYAMTNYAQLSAPLAGAIVSASRAMYSLSMDFKNGKINGKEYRELGMICCSESAIVGISTAIGQTLIPIPVLGAIIGATAGTLFANFAGAKNKKTVFTIQKEIADYLTKLDSVYLSVINKINNRFDKLGELTTIAFDLKYNQRLLMSSIDLAISYNVPQNNIIKNISELDNYMLS